MSDSYLSKLPVLLHDASVMADHFEAAQFTENDIRYWTVKVSLGMDAALFSTHNDTLAGLVGLLDSAFDWLAKHKGQA